MESKKCWVMQVSQRHKCTRTWQIQNSRKCILSLWNNMTQAETIKQMRKGRLSWRILWENFVFQEGETYYKMPTFLAKNVMYRNNDSYEKVCQGLETIKQYFWPLTKMPETVIHEDKKGHYIIEQKKIPGEKLTKNLLESSPELLSKFKRLVIANEIMWMQEWVFLDLLWSDILTHPQTIHNLLTDWKDIYVFDFWLLESTSKNMFFRYFSHFGQKLQILFIKYFF